MAFCTSCGLELGDASFCTNCGAATTGSIPVAPATSVANQNIVSVEKTETGEVSVPGNENNKKKLILWLSISAATILFITAIATARHWEKIDVPAHAETFHTETYLTGNYDIVDDHINLCWIGQNWYQCIDVMIAEYNATCASFPLTPAGSSYCSRYSSAIDEMQSKGNSRSWVSSLGTWGHLTPIAEEATESVSNNDYRPAETHEAVCYLGFLGECK